MNALLQKRIETESKKYMDEAIEMNGVVGDNLHYEDLKTCFIEAATFALNHQWISTSESLPPLDEVSSNASICVIARTSDGAIYYAYYHHYLREWFSCETSTRISGVTHWMFVLEEGGEE